MKMESFYNFCRTKSPLSNSCNNVSEELTRKCIWMMGGKFYSNSSNCSDSEEEKLFLSDFSRILWFSYRSNFESIPGSNLKTDAGWGCMVRVGQMMLAEALSRITADKENGDEDEDRKNLIRMFLDDSEAPFSIQSISNCGNIHGKFNCDWFGPSTIAQTLSSLVRVYQPKNMNLYVSKDGILYCKEMEKLCKNINNCSTNDNIDDDDDMGGSWRPLFVIIPLRLGIDTINPVYFKSISQVFKCPYNIGIAGGKPRSSFYFVATQGNFLYYLDPHVLQQSLPMNSFGARDFDVSTYLNCAVKKMPISDLDPSFAIGFLLRNRNDYFSFLNYVNGLSQFEHSLFQLSMDTPPESLDHDDNNNGMNSEVISIDDDDLESFL